jgi:hypothetical protein
MKCHHFMPTTISMGYLLLLSIFLLPSVLKAEHFNRDTVIHILKTPDFKITGEGTAPYWQRTNWLKLTKAGNGVEYQTDVKILYSDSGIYCLFQCEDSKISARLNADFLDLFNEDVVEAFFWPDDTVPIYFEYELSPLNFELPILVPNMNGRFWGWRPWHFEGNRITRHATHINMDKANGNNVTGWTAEFFIPYTLLKPITNVPAKKGSKWHANFYRLDYDNGINRWYWQPIEKTFHEYRKFGTIQFD